MVFFSALGTWIGDCALFVNLSERGIFQTPAARFHFNLLARASTWRHDAILTGRE
jgi:hypothetical protein